MSDWGPLRFQHSGFLRPETSCTIRKKPKANDFYCRDSVRCSCKSCRSHNNAAASTLKAYAYKPKPQSKPLEMLAGSMAVGSALLWPLGAAIGTMEDALNPQPSSLNSRLKCSVLGCLRYWFRSLHLQHLDDQLSALNRQRVSSSSAYLSSMRRLRVVAQRFRV